MLKVPSSTYRVQLHAGFTLHQLHAQLDYLHALGVDWIYASPVLAAEPGSNHGYDQTDATRLNPALGTERDWGALHAERQRLGMGWLQDIVPNHMAYSMHNPWVRELLTHGEASTVARHFDIDWRHPAYRGRVMLPILGSPLPQAIEAGEVALADDGRGIRVYERVLPLSSRSLGRFDDLRAAALTDVLDAQHYALVHYAETDHTINYRRFFTVNGLICLRAERQETFDATHAKLLEWVRAGQIDGLRVDHIDGLLDPTGYLRRLREAVGPDTYLTVEKILEHGETIPDEWPIEGTSGYDFMAYTGQLLRQPAGHARLAAFAKTFTADVPGADREFARKVFDNKRDFLRRYMAGELDNLVHHARGALAGLPLAGDPERLRDTIAAWLAGFPVYRAYVRFGGFRESDRQLLAGVVDRAAAFDPGAGEGLGMLRAWLRSITRLDDRTAGFLQRAMQLSGPLMAKGIEDTTFYRHVEYLASNEVGDSPDPSHALGIEGWHDRMAERRLTDLNASSTHDTKRGEDARARLHVLSQAPAAWEAFAKTAHAALPPELHVPGDVFLLLAQSLIGAWPSYRTQAPGGLDDFLERLGGFADKALREGKRHSSWEAPVAETEQRARGVLAHWLHDDEVLAALARLDGRLAPQAYLNTLRTVVLKCCAPGAPDVYQGSEYGDFSLVDPDNRRPIDYPARRLSLATPVAPSVWAAAAPGEGFEFDRAKQAVLGRLLRERQRQSELWRHGQYVPVDVEGGEGRVLAFRRVHGDDSALVVLSVRNPPEQVWPTGRDFAAASVRLPQLGPTREVLSGRELELGGEVAVADLLHAGPAAVFVAAG